MNTQEMIKAWKENEKAFGLLSKEMRDFLRTISCKYIEIFSGTVWFSIVSCNCEVRSLLTCRTYRLRPDYPEEPELIEVEIVEDDDNALCIHFDDDILAYTCAPAITKIDDQKARWLRIRFSNGEEIRALYHENPDIKPTCAIFEVLK